jgi:Ca2+-binding EF-hand superfamily protein
LPLQRTIQFEDDERKREELFQAADVNKNGTIDIYEFVDITRPLVVVLLG